NLTMFDSAMEPAALAVAADLGLDAVVGAMRNGYASVVGNSAGDTTPAGVRQRIAIARALLHDPQVLLLDEANLALDSSGDEILRSYLAAQKGSRTMVLVTHRPSILKLADRVLYLHEGRLLTEEPDTESGRASQDTMDAAETRPVIAEDLHATLV